MNARTNKNMSIASIITPDYFKTCLHHDIPLSGCQRVGRSLKPSSVGVVTVQRSLLTHVGVVTLWVARSCFGVKSWKSRKLRYFDSFNLSAVIKDIFLFRWVNCVVVYLLFSRHISYISGMFLHVLAIDSRRGRVHWIVRSIALQTVSVWNVIYRLFTLDTMQKIGVWEWLVR